jgi:hypothetical protein
MLYTVFVAICLAGMSPDQCDRHNAVDWIPAPEKAEGLGMCAKLGLEFAIESHLVTGGTYPKIFCSVGGAGKPDNVI